MTTKVGHKGHQAEAVFVKTGTPTIADGNVSAVSGTLRKIHGSWRGVTTGKTASLKDGSTGAVLFSFEIKGDGFIEFSPDIAFESALHLSGLSALAGGAASLVFVYEGHADTFKRFTSDSFR